MKDLTWDEVLRRTDLIGGDIESQEDGIYYRGPLREIRRQGDQVVFKSPWCARLDPHGSDGWEKWVITTSRVNTIVTPQDIGQGRVFFIMPYLGQCTIFPRGGSKLDPKKVKGLKL